MLIIRRRLYAVIISQTSALARLTEALKNIPDGFPVVPFKIGDGIVVRLQAVQQPHYFDVSAALFSNPRDERTRFITCPEYRDIHICKV